MTRPPGIPSAIPQRYEAAVPLGDLTPHPANPNQGDSGLVGELLEANGFAGAVLAQASTGILIDGEHRLIAARQHGMTTVPVLYLDVDDDTRDRLLASLNESTRRGMNDEAALVALLTGLATTPKGLAGTAYSGDDLDDLVRSLNPPDLESLAGSRRRDSSNDDLWPALSIRVSPETRERFYRLTEQAADRSDAGRLVFLLDELDRARADADADAADPA